MRKLPESSVSIPSNPPIHAVDAQIKSYIDEKRFILGEECAPHTVTRYSTVEGVVTPHEIQVNGRKVTLSS